MTKNGLIGFNEEFDGPSVSALRRAIAEVKQQLSVIKWVGKEDFLRIPGKSSKSLNWP
jgi:hypothetical protein